MTPIFVFAKIGFKWSLTFGVCLLMLLMHKACCFSSRSTRQYLTRRSHTNKLSRTSLAMSTASSTKNSPNIYVVGSANQDLISYTNVIPVLGETVMGENFVTACGGKGANQAVAAACLGLTPVSMICRVGDDIFGENLLANFRKF